MKTAFLVFMMFIFSLGAFMPKGDVWALQQMPELLHHFQEHKKQSDLSFWDFLALHYANPSHHHTDPSAHHQLPALDNHCCNQLWDLPNNCIPLHPSIFEISYIEKPVKNNSRVYFLIQNHETELLRPPALNA